MGMPGAGHANSQMAARLLLAEGASAGAEWLPLECTDGGSGGTALLDSTGAERGALPERALLGLAAVVGGVLLMCVLLALHHLCRALPDADDAPRETGRADPETADLEHGGPAYAGLGGGSASPRPPRPRLPLDDIDGAAGGTAPTSSVVVPASAGDL